MASPFEFAKEWGGPLRPIAFSVPKPLLPAETISFLHYAGVPRVFELSTYQIIRFEFLPTAMNLAMAWGDEMPDCSLPVGWAGLWRIGSITYTQAAAWLCVEELSGRVVAVDVEISPPLYPVNGSVEGMMRCMKLVRDWAGSAAGSLTRAGSLDEAIARAAVPLATEMPYYWQPEITCAIESGCDTLAVAFE
jgi:hypothetical protein